MASFFIGLGFRTLSMSPIKTNNVKYLIRQTTIEQLEEIARNTVAADTRDEAWRLLKEGLRDTQRLNPINLIAGSLCCFP